MERKSLVSPQAKLSLRQQCRLLSISRASFYYEPKQENADNLGMMQLMDAHILEEPTAGVLTMQSMLEEKGYKAGYERIRRLMRLANIRPIYPRKQLTQLGDKKYIYPYLLRNLKVERANQVWAIDITYVAMAKGFMYLTAVIDVYSRYIVGWGLSNTLDAEASLQVLKAAVAEHGKPGIVNSDQGSQFTCKEYVEYLKSESIRISMDGKGRALDNIFIERFWRTIKYQHIYLNPATDGISLYQGISGWMEKYNQRPHQGIDRNKPINLYKMAA
ncbi:IS3 family transposase [Rhodocytophaga rosea]|uniref:IS3 family transposase n=1 Tax=Rhodocytophaga rosea TaxID=2704465 RepID=A0A6C0GKZ0_9BACT|nr:IS3 family transposase [Rhodocytophaga rosea]QHT65354.1 IS3 family transposase [Rhodocytophaga rosea]QHT65520.1 IS3 family transposase [Rhodocytophaga rosea]QHT65881.1 IS3 family transposase [Rhodocytophaga rosea]QHT66212.1 IS3 family transposase [Rhodocytophaga rosea]QHT66410.1 IS3 family transposase [Rhodocytophaga rosea]